MLTRRLSQEQACAEAIDLLDHGYKRHQSGGFHAALVDAKIQNHDIFPFLVEPIVGIVKEKQRKKYVNWILAKHLDSCNWDVKRRMVEILRQRLKRCLPDEFLARSPAQFPPQIPQLIFTHLQTNQYINQTFASYA